MPWQFELIDEPYGFVTEGPASDGSALFYTRIQHSLIMKYDDPAVAGFKDNTLALLQPEGPPLVGKITEEGANKFLFAPAGAGDKAPGLTFTR